MAKPDKGSRARWQSTTITQLGYVANLILTFATASLGFSLTLLKDSRMGYVSCLWLLAVVTLLGSIAVGICCSINRLHDFRETAQIVKKREQVESDGKRVPNQGQELLDYLREENRKRGELTWTLFYWQIGTFGVGVLFLVVAFLIPHYPAMVI
jgi:hypothetical protein